MAHFQTTIASPLSPDEAFARMAAFERVTEWDPNTSIANRVGGATGLGSEFKITTAFGKRVMDLVYRTTAFEAPRRLVLESSLPNGINLRDEITVVPDGTGCRVTYDARILPKGFWRIAEPIFQMIFGKVGARAIIPLSRFLDGTAVG